MSGRFPATHCCSSSLKRSYRNKTLTEYIYQSSRDKYILCDFLAKEASICGMNLSFAGIFYLRKGLSQRLAIRGATPTSWTFLDSNQGLIAYEATALTTELNVQIAGLPHPVRHNAFLRG